MKRAVSDASIYFRFDGTTLYGITGHYFDDNINAGTKKFQKEAELSLKIFEPKPREYDNFTFFGTEISTDRPNEYSLCQSHYIRALEKLPSNNGMRTF